jgi:two-component system, sensor histidine kinase
MTALPYNNELGLKWHPGLQQKVQALGIDTLTKDPALMVLLDQLSIDLYKADEENKKLKIDCEQLEKDVVEASTYIRNAAHLKRESVRRIQEVFTTLDIEPTRGEDFRSENLMALVDQFQDVWSKKAEAQRNSAHSLHLLQTLFSNLPSGILIEDAERHVRFVNEKYCDFFAMQREPKHYFGSYCAQDNLELPRLLVNEEQYQFRIDELIENRKGVVGDELVTINRKRIRRDYIPILVDGVFEGNVWIYTDITIAKATEKKLRRSEEKYRGIIENMNIGLVELDIDLNVKYANQSFCGSTGFELEELQSGRANDALCLHHFSNWTLQLDQDKSNEPKLQEIAVKNKRGELVWFMLTGAPIYSHRGILNGCIGIYLDITHQKQLEQELREAKVKADENSKAKEMFLANMSHEIRTPMNAILGLAKQLEKSNEPIHQKKMLDGINNSAEILMVLVNDILDFSKIEAGELKLENCKFSLRKVLNNINVLMRDRADEKGLILNFNYDANLADHYVGDANRIQQVLLNLVGNGIKFTEEGHVNIRVSLNRRVRDMDQLYIVVEDTGIGMDRNFLTTVFEKFKQEDNTIARKYGGTGLGMSIAKQLINLMGGEIQVNSVKGFGTEMTVTMELPMAETGEIKKIVADEMKPIRLDGIKILLVEDNEFNRLLANKILSDAGANLVECENGKEAIIQCCKESFDLILMDMQMPIMGGVESAFLLLNGVKIDTPIIALTANAIKGEKDKCLEAGMVDFISKPFEEELLLSVCQKWAKSNTNASASVSHQDDRVYNRGYDLSKLNRIANGNKDFVRKMVQIFIKDIPVRTELMKDALARHNGDEIYGTAHKLKPGIDDLGIEDLKSVVREIERLSSKQIFNAELTELIDVLCRGLEKASASMAQDLDL